MGKGSNGYKNAPRGRHHARIVVGATLFTALRSPGMQELFRGCETCSVHSHGAAQRASWTRAHTILLGPMTILFPSDPVAQSRNKDSERCEISMLIFLE